MVMLVDIFLQKRNWNKKSDTEKRNYEKTVSECKKLRNLIKSV